MDEDYLCHYGVLGMKWGIRKARKKTSIFSRKSKKSKKNQNGSQKSEVKKSTTTNVKKLSDQELQNKIKRLQMEKQYRDLKKDEVSTGRRLVGEILKTSGKTLGIQLANYVGGKAINKLFGDEVIKNVGSKKNKNKKQKANNDVVSAASSVINNDSAKKRKARREKSSAFNNSAYQTWYKSATRDPYSRVVNDFFNNKNSYKKAAEAVIVDVKDVKFDAIKSLPPSNMLALPASTKKKRY